MKKIRITKEQLAAFACYEQSYQEMIRQSADLTDKQIENLDWDSLDIPEGYEITAEELLATLEKYRKSKMTREQFENEWLEAVTGILEIKLRIWSYDRTDRGEKICAIGKEAAYQHAMNLVVYDFFFDADSEDSIIDEAISVLKHALENEGLSLSQMKLMEYQKRRLMHEFDGDETIKDADEETLAVYRDVVKEFAKKDDHDALRALGYGSYGGNAAFECDWIIARDCVTRLHEMTGSPVYANTLGYIYYYGRCNDGQPEYDKAYWYFSMGALGGIYESKYKVADMMLNGRGIPKNEFIGESIIDDLYMENLRIIADGDYQCKFADIALREGALCEKAAEENEYLIGTAYMYYLQADFAIRMRMIVEDYYGDVSVANSISESLTRVREKMDLRPNAIKARFYDLYSILSDNIKEGREFDLTIKNIGKGNYKLDISIRRESRNQPKERLFLTLPEISFCGMREKVSVIAHSVKGDVIEGGIPEGEKRKIVFTRTGDGNPWYLDDTLICNGKIVATIYASYFTLTIPQKAVESTYAACVPQGHNGWRHYLCEANVKEGDAVVVEGESGKDRLRVAKVFTCRNEDMPYYQRKYKKVRKI